MKKRIRMSVLGIVSAVSVLSMMLAGPGAAIGQEGISIEQAVICRDVVEREPIGSGDIFPADVSRLCCFTKVVGAGMDTEIVHNWYHDGKMVASVTLPVRSAKWRTYSSKRILQNQVGDWMVEILSASGQPLTKIVFIVN